jgi:uncharacterized protein (TIGR03435 family)
VISLLLLAVCAVSGQTFDVASVKPAAGVRGTVSQDPGRIHIPNANLKDLLTLAYDVKSFQVAGPPWLDTERFEVNATMPPDTTQAQLRVMMQNLLAERFAAAVHREIKELPMYSLVLARGGSKIKESEDAAAVPVDAAPVALPSQPRIGPDGFPVVSLPAKGNSGLYQIMMPGRARLIAQNQSIEDFVTRLTNVVGRPVIDETGLSAKYDFTLTYSAEGLNYPMPTPAASPADSEPLQDIFGAVQSQLGLKLEPKKGPVELIVIDHIEKTPAEN